MKFASYTLNKKLKNSIYLNAMSESAKSRAWRGYVLACPCAWRVYMLTCLRACVLDVFAFLACSRAWRAFIFACFAYVAYSLSIGVLTFLSNYLFYLHKSRLYN